MADLDGADARYAISRKGSGSHLMACVDAHARGVDPRALALEVVGSLDGARKALRDEEADVFMWEKFTTKFLVDAGEWRRIGEVPTPWACFSIAASDAALSESGDQLLTMLEIVKAEAKALQASADCTKTIGLMYVPARGRHPRVAHKCAGRAARKSRMPPSRRSCARSSTRRSLRRTICCHRRPRLRRDARRGPGRGRRVGPLHARASGGWLPRAAVCHFPPDTGTRRKPEPRGRRERRRLR